MNTPSPFVHNGQELWRLSFFAPFSIAFQMRMLNKTSLKILAYYIIPSLWHMELRDKSIQKKENTHELQLKSKRINLYIL